MRPWPKAPRSCLLASTLWQRGDLGGEFGDVLLRAVDDGEPLVELLQILGGVLRGLLQRIAEPVRDRIEPLVDRLLQLRLALLQRSDHALQPRHRVALLPRQIGHDRFGRRPRLRARQSKKNSAAQAAKAAMTATTARTGTISVIGNFPGNLRDSPPAERRANGHIRSRPRAQPTARIDRVYAPLNRRTWLCARSSSCPTSGCGLIPSRSSASTPASASWSMICSRPCTRRPASGSPRSRLASPNASSPWICRRRRTITSRGLHQSGNHLDVRGKVDLRGRLPVDPGLLRGGRAAGAGQGQVSRSRRQGSARSRPSGLFATCLQHEIDHINGVLFIDHISKLKRDRIIKKFAKAAKKVEA